MNFANSAVVVIDMHRGSCVPPGTVFVPRASLIMAPLQRLLREARSHNIPVIFVNYQARQGGQDAKNPLKVFYVLLGPSGDFYTKVLGPASDGIMSMGQWNPKIKWPGGKDEVV